MSQSRFWISNHPTYELAAQAKKEALEKEPEAVFQIRKGLNTFRLVQRFKSNEVTIIRDTKQQGQGRKKGRKKRAATDFSWVGQR